MKKITVIVGPTASGKSHLALKIAQDIDGCVVNADSMQIYQDLSIISARPSAEEVKKIPHFLYGFIDAWTPYSVQNWLEDVKPILENQKNPVVVGGTGLYISSLVNGINDIPDISPEIRQKVREMPLADIKKQLPDFSYQDNQRLRRALEVLLETGKPITYFQNQPKKKIVNADFQIIFINPPREKLYQKCEERFYQMIEQGGLDEVKHLLSLKPTNGVQKAIGVPEITAYLTHKINREEMINQAILSTRHYAKRQITWFKHQLNDQIEIKSPDDLILR